MNAASKGRGMLENAPKVPKGPPALHAMTHMHVELNNSHLSAKYYPISDATKLHGRRCGSIGSDTLGAGRSPRPAPEGLSGFAPEPARPFHAPPHQLRPKGPPGLPRAGPRPPGTRAPEPRYPAPPAPRGGAAGPGHCMQPPPPPPGFER